MNQFAYAWVEAAKDLKIRIVHPFKFKSACGEEFETQGVYLPDFGSTTGTLLTCRFDSDEVMDLSEETSYYQAALNPHCYEPYNREVYVAALNDWGWFGNENEIPYWFAGAIGKHGGI
jgi:hypothetical protein